MHKFIWLLQKLFVHVDEQYQQLSVYYTHKFLLNSKFRKKVVLEKITTVANNHNDSQNHAAYENKVNILYE